MDFINSENISILLFFIGLFGLTARRNIVKTIVSLGVMEAAVVLFFISINQHPDTLPPIGDVPVALMADPFPQAMMITAIVIGVSVTAVNLTLFITMYHRYGTTNWARAAKARLREDQDDA